MTKLLTIAVSFIDGISIPENMTKEDVVAMEGSFKLSFVAEAIQSDNTGNNAQAAFASYWN